MVAAGCRGGGARRRLAGLLGLVAAAVAAASAPQVGPDGVWEAPAARPGGRWLRVLHVNDLHGHVFPRAYAGENLPAEYLGRPIGSLFSVASYVSRVRWRALRGAPEARRRWLRGAEDDVLLLDAGDWTGGALYEATTQGLSTARVLVDRQLGLDATVVGNHAWDYYREGLEGFVEVVGPRVPILGANLRDQGVRPGWAAPSTVLRVDGLRVGLVGLVTEHAMAAALPEKTVGFSVSDLVAALAEEVAALRPDVDVLMVLAHVGCEREPELQARLGAWLAGFPEPPVDLWVDGHSHRDLDFRLLDRVPVVQADHFGTRLGEVLLELGPGGRPTGRLHSRRIVLDADRLPPPRGMLNRHAADLNSRRRVEEELVAPAEAGLVVPALPRSDERLISPIGDLIAAAYLEAVRGHFRQTDVWFGVMNQGGVRMGLYGSGDRLGRAALHAVVPFANTLATLEVGGDALVRFLERGVQHAARLSFEGVDLEVRELPRQGSGVAPVRQLVRARLRAPDGQLVEIDPAARYKLATSQYLAGHGFDGEPDVVRRDLEMTDYEACAAYLQRIAAEDGLVTRAGVARRLPPEIRMVRD